jgi:glutaredoxin
MDFFGKLNAKNTFGMFKQVGANNIVNIICGILLIILIIVLIICLVTKNDNFSNQKKNDSQDIHMYQVVNNLDPNKDPCPFSRRMTELLAKNNNMLGGSRVKKITMEHRLTKQFDVTGTPTIICLKTGKTSVGFKPLDKVLEDLKSDDNESNNNSSDKDIMVCGRMNCPFCVKTKDLLNDLGIEHDFLDSQSDECVNAMKKHNANGVPLIVNKKNNDHIIGFNEEKIRNLKN